ncbi:MAG: HAMP domain-containing sensor histidine kinase [Pseudomonas sp.]|uniref:sensor histidine kinase n=1 Tax=Pseudomonas sp. TaxID=306 RepID=UPI0039827C3A
MRALRNTSLIGRLLWSLCLIQAVVLVTSIAGMLYHIIDENYGFIDDATIEAVVDSTSVQTDALRLNPIAALRELQAANPGLWVVIADEKNNRAYLGVVPPAFLDLEKNLPLLGPTHVRALPGRDDLTVRIEVKSIQNHSVHIMAGGAATSNFNTFVFQATGFLSPYFLIPLILFTLLATPIVVLHATRSVRKLAKDASELDISNLDAHLAEDTVPREIRPLVSAFNATMDRLGKAYHARDRFLRDAAHELRMPIAVLMARIDGMPAHPLKSVLLLDLARLANVAEQLLDLQRLQSPEVDFAPVDLVTLVREVVSELAPIVLPRCDDLVLNAPDHPVWVLGQASSLSRVITNLVQNALLHGGGKGTISVMVDANGTVAVADQGLGVTPEDREHIFQPFYRGATDKPGHGLGLHLAQEIVRAHKGRITVADAPAGGALFSVQLPLLPERDSRWHG